MIYQTKILRQKEVKVKTIRQSKDYDDYLKKEIDYYNSLTGGFHVRLEAWLKRFTLTKSEFEYFKKQMEVK